MSDIDPTLVGPGSDGPSVPAPAQAEVLPPAQAAAEIIGSAPPANIVPGLAPRLGTPPGLSGISVPGITLPGVAPGISLPGTPGIALPASSGITFGAGPAGGQALPSFIGAADELRNDILWGPSGSGKSVQVGWAAYMVAKKLNKKSLIVTADGGAESAEIKALQKLGLVSVLPLLQFENPLAVLDNVFQGYWPIRNANGKWTMSDSRANHQNDPGWYQQVGAMFVESVTSIGDFLMPWLTANPKANIPGAAKDHSVVDGDKTYKFAGMAHYGFLGDRFYQWIHWCGSQRYDKKLWTAREQRSQTDKGMVVIGPDAPGKAITQKIGGWFGGCYHMSVMATGEVLMDSRTDVASDSVLLKGKGAPKNEHRMYIVKHPDPETGIMCDVKNRLSVDRVLTLDKPYIVCEKDPSGLGGSGMATIWGWETESQDAIADTMKDDLQDCMKALKMIPDVTEA